MPNTAQIKGLQLKGVYKAHSQEVHPSLKTYVMCTCYRGANYNSIPLYIVLGELDREFTYKVIAKRSEEVLLPHKIKITSNTIINVYEKKTKKKLAKHMPQMFVGKCTSIIHHRFFLFNSPHYLLYLYAFGANLCTALNLFSSNFP